MTAKTSQPDDFSCEIDPKKVNKAIAYASRVLAMREYSVKLMRDKIVQKGFSKAETESAISFLSENGWLSDRRYCESFIRSKMNRGTGLSRITYEIGQKGVNATVVEQTLQELTIDWQQVCDQVAKKKINSGAIEGSLKGRQKLERFLRYRGFSGDQVFKSINSYFVMGVTASEYDE